MLPKRLNLILVLVIVMLLSFLFYDKLLIKNPEYLSTYSSVNPHMRVTTEVISLKHNPPYVASLRNHSGNLPDIYLNDKSKKPKGFNSTCARFPDFFNLHFRNDHWQIQNTTKGILFLFNAYLDKRDNVVRIVAAYDVYRSQTPLHCQLWYNGSTQPVLVKSEVPFWMFYPKWGADNGYFIHPYLITCPVVLLDNASPVSVSLAENPCDSTTNNVKIYNPDYKEKKNFVVCVKGMSFPYDDHSVRLTEWIELLRILGTILHKSGSLVRVGCCRCREGQFLRVQCSPEHSEGSRLLCRQGFR